MRVVIGIFLTLALLAFTALRLYGMEYHAADSVEREQVRNTLLRADSVVVYDTLSAGEQVDIVPEEEDQKSRSGFVRAVMRTVSARQRDREAEMMQARRERDYYDRFAGKTIGDIHVFRNNVFEGSRLWADRLANSIHALTREGVIRKDLLFHSGEKLEPQLMTRNKQLIRSRSYISDVQILAVPQAADTNMVDVYVLTRDTWTISVDARARDNGESFIELYDDNLAGLGNSFRVRTYLNWKKWGYGGNRFEYRMPNLFGSFFNGRLVAGKGFDNADYGGELTKDFILPGDYAGGASFYYIKEPIKLFPLEDTVQTASTNYDFWAGRSHYFRGMNSSLYYTARFQHQHYSKRPEVREDFNPYFHNFDMLLVNVGLYREEFRRAILIYGYGVEEYIAYGYRFGLTGGYSWGEFGGRGYIGGDFKAGYYTSVGYLGWGFEMGSYINRDDGKFYQTALKAHINYFSPLWGQGAYRVRQFLSLNGTRGWNRLEGYRERVDFRYNGDFRGLKRDGISGLNSLILNTETVIFTPWRVAEFRFAPFVYCDMGLIGDYGNIFRNDFYTTLGIGVRVKNEKLIFNTINLRFGFALGKGGFAPGYPVSLSSADRTNPIRYRPEKAMPIEFR